MARQRQVGGELPPSPPVTPAPAPRQKLPPNPPGVAAGPTLALHYDLLNEQIVIAAACLDAEARARFVRLVTPEHFLHHEHRPIWVALQECERLKLEWSDALAARAGISATLLDSILAGGIRPNVDHHVRTLHWDKAKTSAALGPLQELVMAHRDPRATQERFRALGRHVAEAYDHAASANTIRDSQEVVRRTMQAVNAAAGGVPEPPLGIPGLDLFADGTVRIQAGSAHGKTTVLTARSGCGKSTAAGAMVLGQRGVRDRLGEGQRKVLFGAWEMGAEETLRFLACQDLGWSRQHLRRGVGPEGARQIRERGRRVEDLAERMLAEERVSLEEKMHELAAWVRFWDHPFRKARASQGKKARTNADNLEIIRQTVVDSGCELVLMDLFRYSLETTFPADEDRMLEDVRAMAADEQVHLVLVAQQLIKGEEGVESRADKRPTQSGVKGSGGWTEAGDTMIGMHRPALYKRVPDDVIEFVVLKQRYGAWPLAVECEWDADTGEIRGGREIPYDQPGQAGGEVDEFMAPPKRRRRD